MQYWLGVVSKEHALVGMGEGFVQVCHGKAGPLRRMKAGDWFVFYSPKAEFGGKEPYQKFTGIGRVRTGEVYQADMGGGFKPFRIDVDFLPAEEAAIHPLIDSLSFVSNKKNWGYQFRFGHLKVPEADFTLIAGAMGIDITRDLATYPAKKKFALSIADSMAKPRAGAGHDDKDDFCPFSLR